MTKAMATTSISRWVAAPALLVALAASGVEPTAEERTCFGSAGTPQERAQQCTAVIQATSLPEAVRTMALYNRGVEYRALGRLVDAIDDQTEVLRRRPGYQPAFVARATALLEQGKVPRALADLDTAVELDPRDPRAWHNRGVANRKSGRTARAIEDFGEAIRLSPQLRDSWNGRGAARQAQGDHQAAISDFDFALKLDARSAVVLNNRGVSWRALGDTDRALADFNQAVEINPRYAIGLANRGATWRSAREFSKARADLDAAIAIDPALGMAYFNRGVLELGELHLPQAIADLSAAADLKSDGTAELWLYLARSRAGEDASPRLARAIERLTPGAWSAEIALHLLGRIDATELIRLAAAGVQAERDGRRCEARFFMGERWLLAGKTDLAAQELASVVATCPKGFVELDQASIDLARLKALDPTSISATTNPTRKEKHQ